jgi:peptidoglycan/xylan/chitin deacetylase (PgdA/CDA1 family)
VVKSGPTVILAVLLLLANVAAAGAASFTPAVGHGPRDRPIVALTFDDGNDPGEVREIFAILRTAGVPATFFPYAQAMNADPQAWRRIAAAGYGIGNHSLSHKDLTKLSGTALAAEINGATRLIRTITGRAPIPFLRPPYGAWNDRVAAAAARAGYSILALWDVDPKDWSGISAAAITAAVLRGARDGSVILLHAGPYHTAEALPEIIAGLTARGFRFASMPQLLSGSTSGIRARIAALAPAPSSPSIRLASAAAPARVASALRFHRPPGHGPLEFADVAVGSPSGEPARSTSR